MVPYLYKLHNFSRILRQFFLLRIYTAFSFWNIGRNTFLFDWASGFTLLSFAVATVVDFLRNFIATKNVALIFDYLFQDLLMSLGIIWCLEKRQGIPSTWDNKIILARLRHMWKRLTLICSQNNPIATDHDHQQRSEYTWLKFLLISDVQLKMSITSLEYNSVSWLIANFQSGS